jgi:hypothetical protein
LVIFFVLLGWLFAMHLALTLLFITRVVRELVFSGLPTIFTKRMTDILPGGILAVWIVCAVLIWAAYRIAESEFERVEAPVPRGKPDA